MQTTTDARLELLHEANRLYSQALEQTLNLLNQLETGTTSFDAVKKIQVLLGQASAAGNAVEFKEGSGQANPEIYQLQEKVRETGARLAQLIKEAITKAEFLKETIACQQEDISRGQRMKRAYAQSNAAKKYCRNH
jgi:hypothetical protein